jgi:DNA-binding NarL/FixJ family response regulator
LTIPGGMGGKETIRRLREIDPDVKGIVASGYSNDPVVANFRDYGFCGSLPKPYGIPAIGQAVHDVLTVDNK